jgi:hypothetical protein
MQQKIQSQVGANIIARILISFSRPFDRLLTSVYEAAMFHKQSYCTAKKLDYVPLWFLDSIVAMNVMHVRTF